MRFAGNWRDLDWRAGWGRTPGATGCLVRWGPGGVALLDFPAPPGLVPGLSISVLPNPAAGAPPPRGCENPRRGAAGRQPGSREPVRPLDAVAGAAAGRGGTCGFAA